MAKILFRGKTQTAEMTSNELDQLIKNSTIRHVNEKKFDKEPTTTLLIYIADDILIELDVNSTLIVNGIAYVGSVPRILITTITNDKFGSPSPARSIEKQIFALRQMYALMYLLHAGRTAEIPKEADLEDFDLEAKLLSEEEALRLEAIGLGSLVATIAAWTVSGRKAITSLGLLLFDEGRENLLRRMRAKTETEESDARAKELDLEKKDFNLRVYQVKEIIKIEKEIMQIKDSTQRQRCQMLFDRNLERLNVEKPAQAELTIPQAQHRGDKTEKEC